MKTIKSLHDLGLGIIWLHPKSKRPINPGWTTGAREEWAALKRRYREGMNVGVRLGEASQIGGAYLACIDVDIKDPAFRREAEEYLLGLVGSKILPEVRSGAGNGSRHLYCLTAEPFKMITPLKRGKDVGEIAIYSTGRQMVLPPSIHPDTGKPYKWRVPLTEASDLPLMDFRGLMTTKGERAGGPKSRSGTSSVPDSFEFKEMSVDIDWLPLKADILAAIKTGAGVEDRSGYLLRAANALLACGLDQNEVLNVLTDKAHWLSACAYEHAKTKDRARAAQWVYRFTLKKVSDERDPAKIFARGLPLRNDVMGEDEIAVQTEELKEERSWLQDLTYVGKFMTPASTIQNIVLILKNEISHTLVRRNEFALRDIYSADTPWGARKNGVIKDDDMPQIIFWLSKKYKFEPPKRAVEDALTVIACENAYDPVREQLDALSAWDGTPRLMTWLKDNFGASGDPEYLGQVFSKWMSAMIRRVYEPGAKFDWMPIFEGPQGAGKSSFGRLLVGDEYFLDWLPNLADKDSALGLQGHWCVEMGELPQFKRNELETIKAFITRTVDKFRPPHGRKLLESPRRCVFFGTTNKQTYLIDDTGNRRFKPIEVGQLNFVALKRDRTQLFAEAKHLYLTKFKNDLDYELTGKARDFEFKIHSEKMVEDESTVMYLAMEDFIEKVEKKEDVFDFKKFRLLDLFDRDRCLNKYPLNARNMMFAAKMLKRFGGEKWKSGGLIYWKLDVGDTFL